ncbi:MAG: hypothetical protein ACQETB_13320 [Halobacteriota archaeon]
METACTFCTSDVEAHEQVYVSTAPGEEPIGSFCNYACLDAWIDAESKTAGASCDWEP